MQSNIEKKCKSKGVKLTDQRRIIAKVMSESNDHPNVDELYNRVSKIDEKISIATVYRTVKLYPSSSISSYSELIQFVEDRPGHDKRYAINTNKIEKKLGWYPIETFDTGIYKTIQWYLDNKNLYLDSDKFISMTKRRGKKK
jgi:dTDP-D-glucose 4,6-dehydratase